MGWIGMLKATAVWSLSAQYCVSAFVLPGHENKPHLTEVQFRSRKLLDARLHEGLHDSAQPTTTQQLHTQAETNNYWKLPRLYVGPTRLTQNASVTLSSGQTHYLTKVMRLFKKKKHTDDENEDPASGKDCVRIFNGQDGEWLAKVRVPLIQEEDGKSRKRRTRQRNEILLEAECRLELRKQNENDLERPWVIFAPLKSQPRMKLMIEKCTELGVGAIILAKSDRMDGSVLSAPGQCDDSGNLVVVYGAQTTSTDDDYSGSGLDKLILQAIEASEQCERLSIPRITSDISTIVNLGNDSSPISTVKDIVEKWCNSSDNRKLLICRERGGENNNILPVLDALHDKEKVAFVIGPEGGWSLEEEELFDHICSQSDRKESPVQCVSLGSSVLRAETACMLAVGACALVHD